MSEHGTASSGQLLEFAAAVTRSLPRDLPNQLMQKFIEPASGEELRMILRKAFGMSLFSRDMTKEGWELLEDVGGEPIPASKLELVPFLKEGEEYIKGEELVRRAREELNANLGQRQVEHLLERQEEIPEEWREYYLVFTGTIWCDRGGPRYVPCLYWYGGRWYLYFRWLDRGFDRLGRLLRPCE